MRCSLSMDTPMSVSSSIAHDNVDYFPSYEIVQSSDRAAAWERDLRHVNGAGAQHIMELFLQNYLE